MIRNLFLFLLVIFLGLFTAGAIGVSLDSKITPAVYVLGEEWNPALTSEMARISVIQPETEKIENVEETVTNENVEETVNNENVEGTQNDNNIQDGEGVFKLDEITYYIGTIKNGKPTGNFVLIENVTLSGYGEYNNDTPIDGSSTGKPFSCFQDQFVNELGLKDKSIYVEYVKKDGILNLLTDEVIKVSLSPTEYLYIGKTKNNLAQGKGSLYRLFGNDLYYRVYSGDFKNGYFDGEGIYYYWNGNEEYVGEFEKGLEHGKGKEFDSDGKISYDGYYDKGSYDKKGALYVDGILVYEGEWKTSLLKSGEKEGKGKSYYLNGQLEYDGEWKAGEFHGKGIYYNEEGTLIYKGQFKNGDPE